MADEHTGDPAQAFEDLRAEVSVLRRAIEALPAAMRESRSPDYSQDLAVIGKGLDEVGEQLETILKSPALTRTPEQQGQAIANAGAKRCARWLAINAKIERLQTRWAKLEGWLGKKHAWYRLSPAEQQALPWAKELRDIDGCLDLLFEQRDALLESLPTHGGGIDSVIAKLAVVERLIWPCDHPEAHALIAGARLDLIAMSRESPTP